MKINPKQPRNEEGKLQKLPGEAQKSKTIGVRVDPTTYQKLKDAADNLGFDVVDIVRVLIDQFINDEREVDVKIGSRKVEVTHIETGGKKVYGSLGEAAKRIGVSKSNLSNVCNGKLIQTKGYKARYIE